MGWKSYLFFFFPCKALFCLACAPLLLEKKSASGTKRTAYFCSGSGSASPFLHKINDKPVVRSDLLLAAYPRGEWSARPSPSHPFFPTEPPLAPGRPHPAPSSRPHMFFPHRGRQGGAVAVVDVVTSRSSTAWPPSLCARPLQRGRSRGRRDGPGRRHLMLLHGPGHRHLVLMQLLTKHGCGEGGAWNTRTWPEYGEGDNSIWEDKNKRDAKHLKRIQRFNRATTETCW
jgi:hypothetical protein